MNRFHYEGIYWTMGTILVATSLALFGISFLKDLAGTGEFERVALMALFSLFLFVVWLGYGRHVDPWIRASQSRCREIEEVLSQNRFGLRETPKLQSSIWKEDERTKPLRGKWITISLMSALLLAWFLRIALISAQQIFVLIGLVFILFFVIVTVTLLSSPKS